MPKMPQLSGKELIKILAQFGFGAIRQKGSHVILKKKTKDGEIGTVVPLHKVIAEGTLRGILKQAKIETDEFLSAI
ncbi:MAG: type II toxin-antitoxin system HicA family toxin [Bacteroidota bacterium]|nr:type II toxin-antitoxin system HicA family toxin [Bacteroidota bacterium]